jgi:DNA gyrase/topoisomerase IV subunit A
LVYRNEHDALTARLAALEEELEDERRAHAQTRESLIALRRKYARARSVLAMIAHNRKVQLMLAEAKVSNEELAEMTRPPTIAPPSPATTASSPPPKSTTTYLHVDDDRKKPE